VTVVNKQEYLPSVPRIALVGIPEIKANLIEHLVPSLENQIAEVIQPAYQCILYAIPVCQKSLSYAVCHTPQDHPF
jgi:hypothetical protein